MTARFTIRTLRQPRAACKDLPDDWDRARETAQVVAAVLGEPVEVRDNSIEETCVVCPDGSLGKWADDAPMTRKEKVAEALDEIEDA